MKKILIKSIIWWFVIVYIFSVNIKQLGLDQKYQYDRIVSNIPQIIKPWFIEKEATIKDRSSEVQNYKMLISIVDESLKWKHSANRDYKEMENKLCKYYNKICEIITIEWGIKWKDRFYYLGISVYLIKFFWNYLPQLYESFYSLTIQPSILGRRWYAWYYSIILNIKNSTTYDEFLKVTTHELWHIIDLWVLQWKSKKKDNKYTEFWNTVFSIDDPSIDFYKLSWTNEKIKKKNSNIKDFVSWYALSDPFEDFAESLNMYLNLNSTFRKMAKESYIVRQKYLFIKQLFKNKYIKSGKTKTYKFGYRPRDSTKF